MPETRKPAGTPVTPDPKAPIPSKSDARVGGMVATVALLFIFAFTAVIVWLA